jgi:hypothetical protein
MLGVDFNDRKNDGALLYTIELSFNTPHDHDSLSAVPGPIAGAGLPVFCWRALAFSAGGDGGKKRLNIWPNPHTSCSVPRPRPLGLPSMWM